MNTNNLANQYYLKAWDAYPYNTKDVMEALDYALSYDEEHAPSHCLTAMLYTHQVKSWETAKHHYELALLYDPSYLETYYQYPYLLMHMGHYSRAKQVILKGQSTYGVSPYLMIVANATMYELQGKYDIAIRNHENALLSALSAEQTQYAKDSISRIKEKSKPNTPKVEQKEATPKPKMKLLRYLYYMSS